MKDRAEVGFYVDKSVNKLLDDLKKKRNLICGPYDIHTSQNRELEQLNETNGSFDLEWEMDQILRFKTDYRQIKV